MIEVIETWIGFYFHAFIEKWITILWETKVKNWFEKFCEKYVLEVVEEFRWILWIASETIQAKSIEHKYFYYRK